MPSDTVVLESVVMNMAAMRNKYAGKMRREMDTTEVRRKNRNAPTGKAEAVSFVDW